MCDWSAIPKATRVLPKTQDMSRVSSCLPLQTPGLQEGSPWKRSKTSASYIDLPRMFARYGLFKSWSAICSYIHVRQQKLSKSNIKKHHQKNMTTDSQPTLTTKKTGWCKSRNMVFSSWTRGHLFWATFLGNICGSPGWCYYNYITLWSFNVVMENHHV